MVFYLLGTMTDILVIPYCVYLCPLRSFGRRCLFVTIRSTMNPLNDLIQSHNMYDAMEQHAHRDAVHTPPPLSYQTDTRGQDTPSFGAHTYQHPPEYRSSEPVQPPMQAVQQYHHPRVAPMPPQGYQTDQERHTMHTMMREISLMQRRLSGMITSLEAMMERTDILHEYHHIARYSSERAAAAHTMVSAQPPRYTPPSFTDYRPPQSEQHTQYNQPQVPSYPPYSMQVADQHQAPAPQVESPMSIKEGVFNGTHMISAEGDIYAIPVSFLCDQKLIEGDIMQAMVFASGQIKYKLSEPTPREHIMGILSTHSGTSPFYIVQTANKAYNVLKEAVELAGATPGKQILLTVPAGGESEWATIEKVFS